MKKILLLSLLLLPIVALAQYPTFSNKQKLGVQTTGDGLIFRGTTINNIPNYTPSNVNNAYFHLDTTASKLYLYSVGTWQQVYPTASDTTSLGAYLLKSDTLSMLLPYLRKSDTISLSNRINNKLNATDTVSLSNRINLKLNKTDTINLSNRIDLKLNKSDTISLSNRINIKLNASDTVSLSNRINKKLDTLYVNYQTNVDLLTNKDTINITPLEAGAGINITNNIISLDTTLLDSVVRVQNVYVKNGTGTVLNKGEAVYVTGANGTNIIVGRASNVAESSSSKTLGLTMTSIAIDGFGYVVKEGLLAGLNTNSANAGDPIWLSNTPGGLIFGLANKPYAPNHLVYLGVVTRKQQNNGEVYVTVQNGFEIKELHDVQIIDPVNKASLYYNSSQSLWRDTTAALLVSDTVSMLSKYVNTYSNQTGINGNKTFNNVITIDSATVTGKLLVNTNISDAVKISSNTNSTNLELMNSGGTVSIKSSNKNMILQTDTTALVYLNGDNKKVGILTMNPQQELEVNGNARITGLNNNLVPLRIVGSSNNNDLTNVNLGEGLSFANDTLKVDLTIIDTAIAASSITLTGPVTGIGSTNSTVPTIIGNGVVTNDMLAGSISDSKLNTITTAGKVSNSATTATSANTNNTIVSRDGSGNFSAGIITASLNGNANTSTTLATGRTIGITGDLTYTSPSFNGSANVTAVGTLANSGVTANTYTAATVTVDAKGRVTSASSNTIPTVNDGTLTMAVSGNGLTGSQTFTANQSSAATFTVNSNATSSNTPSTIVYRDASGNFSAGNITANNFLGNATSSTNSINTTNVLNYLNSNEIFKFKTTNATNVSGQRIVTTPGTDFSVARIDAAQTFTGTQTFSNTISGSINGNAATVTSVLPSNFASQTANTVLAAPNGSSGTPTFRLLTSTDIPSLNYLSLTGGTLSGALNGTTGTFNTRLGVGSYVASPTLFTSGSGDQEIHFTHSDNVPGRKVSLRLTNNNGGFYTYGGLIYALQGEGLNQYNRMSLGVNTTEIMHLTRFSRVGIMNDSPSYTLDVNGQIGSTGFIKSGGLSTQFLKADGSVDANTYLTSGTAAYLPLAGGTLTGTLNGINQNLNSNLSLTDPIAGNAPRIYTSVTTGPSSTAAIRLALDQSTTGGANMFMGGSQLLGGSGTNPNIFFTDSRRAYASVQGIYSGAGTIISGHIVFNTTPNDATTALTERMRISQDGAITMSNTLGVTGATTINNVLTINSGASNGLLLNGTNNQFIKVYSSSSGFANAGTWYQNATTGQTEGSDGLFVGIVGGTGSYFTNYENSKTYFRTFSNANQLVLDTDGNVGIGIEDATAKLDVSGTLKVSGTTTLSNLGTNGTRMVVTDNNGLLSTQAIPSSGSGTVTNVTGTLPISVVNGTTTPSITIADASTGASGVVNTTTQSFAGVKTFINPITAYGLTLTSTTGSNTNKLLGLNNSGGAVGQINLGVGLTLTNDVLSVNNKITDINTSQYTILSTDFYIDNFNNSSTTIILPLAGLNTYRELKFKNSSTGAIIANGNIIPLSGSGTTTTILPATNAKWCTLVSDGSSWRIMQSN